MYLSWGGEPLFLTKLVIESLFIYNWSTRSIDEIGGLFHQAQFAGADQPLGRGAGLLFNREGLECNGQGASEVELIGKLGGIGKRGDDDDRCLAGRDGKGYATTRGQGSVAAILIRGQAIGGGIGRGKGRGIGAEEGVDAAAAGIADRAGGQAEVGRTGRGIGNAECVIQDRRAHARGAAANAGLAVIGRIIGVQRTGERRGDTARIQQRGVLTGFAHWRGGQVLADKIAFLGLDGCGADEQAGQHQHDPIGHGVNIRLTRGPCPPEQHSPAKGAIEGGHGKCLTARERPCRAAIGAWA